MDRATIEHETLLVRRGPRTGIHTIVAVHSTRLGPALGGCRMWHHETLEDAIEDALRLSGAMTLKAAAAGLDLGGGKSVIWLPEDSVPAGDFRGELMRDFAETVEMLGGAYITAEDVGTTIADMELLAEHTDHVVGRPLAQGGSGDPGPRTAVGVEAAMRACCSHRFGASSLAGRRVAIVGVGSVGAGLSRSLAAAGALLVLSDVDQRKRVLADELDAEWLAPREALRAPLDVLAPCALGGVLDGGLARELRCEIVCGCANNQLGDDRIADLLASRGILYAPDFIVNAGGLINVALELSGYDPVLATRRVAEIEQTMNTILDHAESVGLTPLSAARELASQRLAAGPLRPLPAAA
jgi:leucine dehydrogenase